MKTLPRNVRLRNRARTVAKAATWKVRGKPLNRDYLAGERTRAFLSRRKGGNAVSSHQLADLERPYKYKPGNIIVTFAEVTSSSFSFFAAVYNLLS